jgi:hypothetical protein
MVIEVDTCVRTSPHFEGHYYCKSFRRLLGEYLEKAIVAQNNIKTLSEIAFEDIALGFD